MRIFTTTNTNLCAGTEPPQCLYPLRSLFHPHSHWRFATRASCCFPLAFPVSALSYLQATAGQDGCQFHQASSSAGASSDICIAKLTWPSAALLNADGKVVSCPSWRHRDAEHRASSSRAHAMARVATAHTHMESTDSEREASKQAPSIVLTRAEVRAATASQQMASQSQIVLRSR